MKGVKSIQTEKMYALGQLSSSIAHEIRNPLFALNNNIEYIKQNIKDDDVFNGIYPDLKTSIERIHKTVSTILDFAKPHKTEMKDVNINDVINNSLILVKKQFTKSAIRIDENFDEKTKPIKADPHQLEQVFVNLFLNSFLAMDDQPGILTIVAKSQNKRLIITISDTGKGIPSDEIDRIFDPFYSTFRNGTGLGLAIVQRILDEHNATYKVESEENFGTTFNITFRY